MSPDRIAIISDIHSNLHALEVVLDEIKAFGIDDILCLGDVVGYGPFPRECLDLVFEHCEGTVLGNHDEAAFVPEAAAFFNGNAKEAIEWTRDELHPRHIEMLQLLPNVSYIEDLAICIHASPVRGPSDYIHDQRMAAKAFRGVDRPACLVGHTHVPLVFEAPDERVESRYGVTDIAMYPLGDGQGVRLKAGKRYICNPGSVGQPRDNDPRASFGILDLPNRLFSVHRVAYDIEAAQKATQAAGLPQVLADRLALGA